jgi:3-(3-hydroxy-phenyl)propionate hydroxylase
MQASSPLPDRVPVLIAGGGPVGLACAALLASHGIESLVVEADDGYCSGSRAICITRRSQEIFSWFGAQGALLAKALPWTDGRSYFRGAEVLHFSMPLAPTDRYAPMVNIQQYYLEQFSDEAVRKLSGRSKVCWSSRVCGVRPDAHGVDVDVGGPDEALRTVRADWLVACDGARSKVREELGLAFEGMQYDGRYVIVDIEQKTKRGMGRLVWFDPPSNPGSTLVMHRQPDDVWRVDYQLRDDEDPVEAVKPENVLPRVQSHLEMIGETEPWKALWISIYNAKCLSLREYRHGRVLFAGDAAHLVPIFGVRGLNSGLEDAANLAWKLALVLQGQADEGLLDSYSVERVHATRVNVEYGAKSTEFMAPPNFGFRLMRQAALRLSVEEERTRPLINPRQSTPVAYPTSPLNATGPDDGLARGARAGEPAPDAKLGAGDGASHLSERFGAGFVALHFSDDDAALPPLAALAEPPAARPGGLQVWRIARRGAADARTLLDDSGAAWRSYGAQEGTLVLVRPDGYVLGRWAQPDWPALRAALGAVRRSTQKEAA